MFGFLKPDPSGDLEYVRYRQVYAAFCAHHRIRYGVLASLLTSLPVSSKSMEKSNPRNRREISFQQVLGSG